MSLDKEQIENIRQSVNIVEFIDQFVPLKRAGANYKALSPFKKEKTPSFVVNPSLQIFKCFSSGHGGDVFKFLQIYENLDFPTAVRRVAEFAGIRIEESSTPEERKSFAKREQLLALHTQVLEIWKKNLRDLPQAQPARDYMSSREIPLSWIEEYDLGYAADSWDAILSWGNANAFDTELLVESGLVLKNPENGRTYDRFRHRLMFPIHDDAGRCIAFSGRLLDSNSKAAKYINSPETPLFNKSKTLFAFHRAKRPILDQDTIIICEGQIDVLRCHSVGLTHTVAPLGTAFTADHCRAIRRLTQNVILCLDADSAGMNAANRAANTFFDTSEDLGSLIQSDLGIRVATLPPGEDPDSLIREKGLEAFQSTLNQPKEYIDFFLDLLSQRFDNETIAGKQSSAAAVADFLGKVKNAALREQLTARASSRLQITPTALTAEIKSPSARPQPSFHEENLPIAETFSVEPFIDELIQLIINWENLIPEFQRLADPAWFESRTGGQLISKILDLHYHDMWEGLPSLISEATPAEQNYLSSIHIYPPEEIEEKSEASLQHLKSAIQSLHLHAINTQISLITQSLKDPQLDNKSKLDLLTRLTQLQKSKKQRPS